MGNYKQPFTKGLIRVRKSGIDALVAAAKTIEWHLGGILNYLEDRATNASNKNFNRK